MLAVRVRNDGRNSRWYSGSGIYRHVWLNTTGERARAAVGPLCDHPGRGGRSRVGQGGGSDENGSGAARDVTVRIRLADPGGASAGTHEVKQSLAAGGSADVAHVFSVAAPQFWSAAAPRLYRAQVDLLAGGAVADSVATTVRHPQGRD